MEDRLQQAAFNPSYIGLRNDVAKLVPTEAKSILDVGCSIGVLGSYLQQRNQATVIGIEYDLQMAEVAKGQLDDAFQADVETFDWGKHFQPGQFDCIIFADLLEHLRDPWTLLKNANPFLAADGSIVASIPNVAHISTIARMLFQQDWPYRDRGIHDRTHLRFFVLRTIKEMFAQAGFDVIRVERNYRIFDIPKRINGVARYLAPFGLRSYLTYQYRLVATKVTINDQDSNGNEDSLISPQNETPS